MLGKVLLALRCFDNIQGCVCLITHVPTAAAVSSPSMWAIIFWILLLITSVHSHCPFADTFTYNGYGAANKNVFTATFRHPLGAWGVDGWFLADEVLKVKAGCVDAQEQPLFLVNDNEISEDKTEVTVSVEAIGGEAWLCGLAVTIRWCCEI